MDVQKVCFELLLGVIEKREGMRQDETRIVRSRPLAYVPTYLLDIVMIVVATRAKPLE